MAGLSIYDVNNWSANTNYNLYDIYKYNNFFYYATAKHNSGSIFSTDFSNGVITHNNTSKPYFFFKPSYNSDSDQQPKVKETQFGDGYVQRIPDGINNTLLLFNLNFDKRTNSEARAIIHFLETKKSAQSFVFTPPFPYNKNKLFICRNFRHVQIFENNHTITAQFVETPL